MLDSLVHYRKDDSGLKKAMMVLICRENPQRVNNLSLSRLCGICSQRSDRRVSERRMVIRYLCKFS